jgi:hypothetical protein
VPLGRVRNRRNVTGSSPLDFFIVISRKCAGTHNLRRDACRDPKDRGSLSASIPVGLLGQEESRPGYASTHDRTFREFLLRKKIKGARVCARALLHSCILASVALVDQLPPPSLAAAISGGPHHVVSGLLNYFRRPVGVKAFLSQKTPPKTFFYFNYLQSSLQAISVRFSRSLACGVDFAQHNIWYARIGFKKAVYP